MDCCHCAMPGPETELQCVACQNLIPFDIATGATGCIVQCSAGIARQVHTLHVCTCVCRADYENIGILLLNVRAHPDLLDCTSQNSLLPVARGACCFTQPHLVYPAQRACGLSPFCCSLQASV